MNRCVWMLASIVALLFLAVGCSGNGGGNLDTSKMESSFSSADPSTQGHAQNAVSAIKAGDYPKALNELRDLGNDVKLTPEQKRAVTDTLAAVQQKIAGMTQKAASEAGKALEGAKQGLPK